MKIYRHMDDILQKDHHEPCGIAIGTFDGLHIGHRKVIETLLTYCRENGLRSVVYTFANHPREFTCKEDEPNRIITVDEKIDLFDSMGLDELIMVEFDADHMNMDAEIFVKEILKAKLNLRYLVAGYNFRFGAGARGDGEMLSRLAPELGYGVYIVEPLILDGEPISSSRIRNCLREGDIEMAGRLLGRHHSVSGPVISGKRLGNTIGFPTANLKVSANMALIQSGVYVTRTWLGKEVHHSVTNVGYNPTFDQQKLNLETHLLRFNGDLYHKFIRVEFLHRLRGEVRFSGKEELAVQIQKDVEAAEAYFRKHFHH